ncbi:uncharacterized protein LOC122954101 [Acropora millepora]|uniref:uncharacterized protein LOC122954101 n=1 Tax=Acropora millepora TaxID=45264 RepID=UPI001CF5F40E|nr:uncharacterized protein LOC122954101 [Acropora millepora]
MAKSRVPPIKPVSVPRMELTAAVVSVNVTTMLKSELDYENLKSVYYTDSEVVIGYINNEARRFHVYVGNRVQYIRDRSNPEQWHHVYKDNPADEASRSLTASQLLKNTRWFRGPEFLWKTDVPPRNVRQMRQLATDDVEVKANTFATTCSQAQEPHETSMLFYLNRVSSWQKAKTIVAWIRRAIVNLQQTIVCKTTFEGPTETHPLSHPTYSRSYSFHFPSRCWFRLSKLF